MEQLRQKIDHDQLDESVTLHFVQWELSKSLLLKELIYQQSAYFGSAGCNVNTATNYSIERIGKPTSIGLNDPRAEMKISSRPLKTHFKW